MTITIPNLTELDPAVQAALRAITTQLSKQYGVAHTDQNLTKHALLTAYHNQTQSHTTSGAFEAVLFNSEDDLRGVLGIVPPTGLHSKTTTTQRFLIVGDRSSPQRYLRLRVRVLFAANATGDRSVRVMLNDAVVRRPAFYRAATAGGPTRLTTEVGFPVSPGDAVHIEAYQDSGGALNLGSTDRTDANEIELELI